MPSAKLIIANTPGETRRELNQLAGTSVADYRDLSEKFSLADVGVEVANARDSWEIAYEAVRQPPEKFFEPDFPSGFHVDTTASGEPRAIAAMANIPHPHDQIQGDIKGPGFAWHRLEQYAQLEHPVLMQRRDLPQMSALRFATLGSTLTTLRTRKIGLSTPAISCRCGSG
jgi:hypothetical protein